jgi:hypothetical protein
MKKKIVLLLTATSLFLTLSAFAWTPIQFSVFEGVKNFPNSSKVDGVKIGIPFSANYWGLSQEVNGLEFGIFTQTNNSNGLQLACVNIDTSNCSGMQLAGANISRTFAGFQTGIYNEVTKQSEAVQLGGVNTAKFNSSSFQIGAINNNADNSDGTQVGILNVGYGFKGVQVGIFNGALQRDSDSFQIGLLNYMEDGFFPVFPFFNFKVK